MKKGILIAALAIMVIAPISASAATWYKKDLLLPRIGQWNTTARNAVSNTQGTYVSKNGHDVVSWIEINNTDEQIGPDRYWDGGNKSPRAQYHHTGLRGAKVHASFKSRWYNYMSTHAHVEWAP
ncbi:hypothetical protein [Bacillus paralicheniformis]|uniref:hypothetical protein n=1 Tax=Bacillus paralicheniformis TaxID=1648923 RepID=UPI00128AE6B1|nr:hypothetical protein [Bacillus paralicheniformis]MPQ23780.1 hypothetical protein [Bacillus paralicheniformis]